MKILFLITSVVFFFSFDSQAQSVKRIKVNEYDLELTEFKKSVNGDFILSLAEYDTINLKNKEHSVNELIVLDQKGNVKFNKTIKGQGRPIFISEFKRFNSELYSYFVSLVEAQDCNSTLRFLDNNFNEVIKYDGINLGLDCHEALSFDKDNILLIYNTYEKFKLPEVRELKSDGSLKFLWKLSDHYPDYKKYLKHGVDVFHLNSVSSFAKDKFLVSLCEQAEILIINYPSGKIEETISSKKWKFINDPYVGFDSQHNPQILKNGNLILFDNGFINSKNEKRASRVVEYKLDYIHKTAKLVWEYKADFISKFRLGGAGSVQVLANGNVLIGWGFPEIDVAMPPNYKYPIFTEVDRTGKVVRTLTSSKNLVSYRVHFSEATEKNHP